MQWQNHHLLKHWKFDRNKGKIWVKNLRSLKLHCGNFKGPENCSFFLFFFLFFSGWGGVVVKNCPSSYQHSTPWPDSKNYLSPAPRAVELYEDVEFPEGFLLHVSNSYWCNNLPVLASCRLSSLLPDTEVKLYLFEYTFFLVHRCLDLNFAQFQLKMWGVYLLKEDFHRFLEFLEMITEIISFYEISCFERKSPIWAVAKELLNFWPKSQTDWGVFLANLPTRI